MIATDIISDGLFAAVAAMGFGSISDPPMRAFPYIAILAAVGHAARYCLMNFLGVDIVSASLVAAFIIGTGSVFFGRKVFCPMTVLYIPALLPMVPGTYAYKTVFSLIMFFQEISSPTKGSEYLQEMIFNGAVSFSVLFMLAVGAHDKRVEIHLNLDYERSFLEFHSGVQCGDMAVADSADGCSCSHCRYTVVPAVSMG